MEKLFAKYEEKINALKEDIRPDEVEAVTMAAEYFIAQVLEQVAFEIGQYRQYDYPAESGMTLTKHIVQKNYDEEDFKTLTHHLISEVFGC